MGSSAFWLGVSAISGEVSAVFMAAAKVAAGPDTRCLASLKNCSWAVWPTVRTAWSTFLMPGSATEIWSEPWICTAASLTPRPLTRRLMMLIVWSSWARDGLVPFSSAAL